MHLLEVALVLIRSNGVCCMSGAPSRDQVQLCVVHVRVPFSKDCYRIFKSLFCYCFKKCSLSLLQHRRVLRGRTAGRVCFVIAQYCTSRWESDSHRRGMYVAIVCVCMRLDMRYGGYPRADCSASGLVQVSFRFHFFASFSIG